MLKRNKIIFIVSVCLFGCWGIGTHPLEVMAEEADPVGVSLEISEDGYKYVFANRPDPFKPFLSKRTVRQDVGIVKSELPLTGMRRFEPGQLKLVAILGTSRKRVAMVEDVAGQGYIINEGTEIGRHGVITNIQDNEVTIKETMTTTLGEKIENIITMSLEKEGEE